jgi:hypothetical protein
MSKTAIVLFAFLSFQAAQAADDLVVEVPRSALPLPSEKAPASAGLTYFELGVSNWQPGTIAEESRLPATSEFSKNGSPMGSVNFASPLGWAHLSAKFGLSFLQLERSGYLGIQNTGYRVSQNLNIFQPRLGLEWNSPRGFANFRPFLGAGVLPTWLQSSSSEFNGGVSDIKWTSEFYAGLDFSISVVTRWLGLDDMSFNVAYEHTQGIDNGYLTGNGVVFGTRVGWN